MQNRPVAIGLALVALLTLTRCSSSKPQPATPAMGAAPSSSAPVPNGPGPNVSSPGTAPVASTPVQPAPAQGPAPAAGTPSSLNEQVPFKDAGKVRQAIAAPGPVNFQVINLGPVSGDKEQYLEDLLAKAGLPAANDMVLVIFSADGNDIRFALGSVFYQKGVKAEEILALVRQHYLPQAREGRPEDGIVNLVAAVNQRMKG